MKTIGLGVLCGMLATVMLTAGADQKQEAERLLKAATNTELVDGNLKAAIDQYQRIVDVYGKADRATTAKALLRLAECHQKLGDAQAQRIYERVVRDFGDQTETAATARARLAPAGRPAASTATALRKVWREDALPIAGVRNDTQGAVSADGRFMSYFGELNTKLVLRDLMTGSDRTVWPAGQHGTFASAISKDGLQLAFNVCSADQTTCEIRVASLQGTGVPQSRRLFGGDDVRMVVPQDWSPDGKWIAVSLRRKDRTGQIGIVAVGDGALRVLKSVDWRGPSRMFFSPDGRAIAYDLPAGENELARDVLVMAVDGSRELPIASHSSDDRVMGWSPDGAQLLFDSDRSGTMGLWMQPFADGKPHGRPELLKPDIGHASSMGVTSAGALHLLARNLLSNVEVASIDLTRGTQPPAAMRPLHRFTGSNRQPTWSPDGKQLAYQSLAEPPVITVWSADSGAVRELRPRVPYFVGLSWAPDGSYFAVYSSDLKGRAGVYRIDSKTGDVAPIIYQTHIENLSYEGFSWSPDGKRLYYHTRQRGLIYEVDLASGSERVLRSAPALNGTTVPDGRIGQISLSPDGRWIAAPRSEASGTAGIITLLPIDGGSLRDLLRVNAPEEVANHTWTPDGRAVLVLKQNASGAGAELCLVPIDGSAPKKLDFDASQMSGYGSGRLGLHPSGDRLAYATVTSMNIEVWALENFLPAQTGKPSAKK